MGTSSVYGFLVIGSVLASCLLLSSSTAVDFNGDLRFLHFPAKPACGGSIADAECMLGGDALQLAAEFEMESEISRRILATTRYISYGAMRRNSVPCSRRGASYYNCRPGAEANPYSRGCSTITRCRR